MAKKDSKDQVFSVYAYLRVITIAGGIASVSLPFAVQSMIEISMRNVYSENISMNEVFQPVTLPEIVITGELLQMRNDESESIPENKVDLQVISDSGYNNSDPIEENAVNSKIAISENQLSETAINEPIADVDAPRATVDVFPVGYGSFRIIIESETEGSYIASLFDSHSNEIISENYDVYIGENTFVLESGSIPQGEYLLRVTNGSVISERRVRLK